jgi:hypothetical protein
LVGHVAGFKTKLLRASGYFSFLSSLKCEDDLHIFWSPFHVLISIRHSPSHGRAFLLGVDVDAYAVFKFFYPWTKYLHVSRFVFSYLLPACYINRDVLHQLPGWPTGRTVEGGGCIG